MECTNMDYVEPICNGFTIYSKSGCVMCSKVKNLLKDNLLFFETVDCDEYLIEDKEAFLSFMQKKIGKEYRQFPMVFYKGEFVGGYPETSALSAQLLLEIEGVF